MDSSIFDAATVISGTDKDLIRTVLKNSSVQNLIMDLLEVKETLIFGMNEVDLDFVPAFKNQSNFGIFTKQAWLVDEDIIEVFFTKIRQLRALLSE